MNFPTHKTSSVLLSRVLAALILFRLSHGLPETAFWNNDWPSDLTASGDEDSSLLLEGTVLFAQSQIFPSKNGIPNDDQPRLAAQRKTLVMMRPHDIIDDATKQDIQQQLTLTVRSKDGTVLSNPILMKDPEEIPKHDGWIDLGTMDVDVPSQLESPHIADTQETLEAIAGTEDGKNPGLANFFQTENNEVQARTSNGNWVSTIHLPTQVPGDSRFRLVCDSTWPVTLVYPSVHEKLSKTLSQGESLVVILANGVWVANEDPKPLDVPQFPASLESPYIVRYQSNLNTIGDDADATGLTQLLNDASQEIEIQTQNGSWVRNIYLPDGTRVPSNSKIQIACDSSWTVNVYYPNTQNGGYRKRILSKGQKLILVLHRTAWLAKDDLQHNDYIFGHHFYTALLEPGWVRPGMTLEFEESLEGRRGILEANVGGFTEVFITTLDAGFLTEPRNEFTFRDDPTSNREYYETTVASRLIVAQYETMHLTEIMLPSGIFYDEVSSDEGGVYSGDMRQWIGKILLSHGIDMANYGISSSLGQSESSHPYTCAMMAAHNTVGMYTNGRVVHGLSGGNGMVTLLDSVGNEMSHEIGHNYGLGHNVEGFAGSVHRSSDQINSSWGWDSRTNMFRPNFAPADTGGDQCLDEECQSAFLGKYRFGTDAMAGGEPMWGSNRFTMYTPNSAQLIQEFLEGKAIWAETSSTGFLKYDSVSGEMIEFLNTANGQKAPRLHKVPVTTILGYYETDANRGLQSYIYPAMHGALGYVYDDDGPSGSNGCKLVVETKGAGTLVYTLATSVDPKGMNKFHINVATAEEPLEARIVCQETLLAQRALEGPKETLAYTVNGIPFESDTSSPTPSPTNNTCVDRDDLKLGKKKRDCAWIAKQRLKKRKKFCRKKKKKKKVKDYWCPATCATCATAGTSANNSNTIVV